MVEEAETDLWTSGKLGGDSLQGEKWAGGTEAVENKSWERNAGNFGGCGQIFR